MEVPVYWRYEETWGPGYPIYDESKVYISNATYKRKDTGPEEEQNYDWQSLEDYSDILMGKTVIINFSDRSETE